MNLYIVEATSGNKWEFNPSIFICRAITVEEAMVKVSKKLSVSEPKLEVIWAKELTFEDSDICEIISYGIE